MFRYFRTSILLIFLSGCSTAQKQIHVIQSFDEAQSAFAHANKDTLVVFDIDRTLIVPTDPLLQDNVTSFYKKNWKQIGHHIAQQPNPETYADLLTSKIMAASQWMVIEPKIVNIIADLRERGAKIVALTNATSGAAGVIPSVEEWRSSDLLKHKIDFSSQWPRVHTFDTLPAFMGNHPLLYKGILLTNQQPKGAVLGAFLDLMQWKPANVIFFDDKLDYLQSVAQEMRRRNIRFQGYQYLGADKLPIAHDEAAAQLQVDYLVKHDDWLSIEAAQRMLEQNRAQPIGQQAI